LRKVVACARDLDEFLRTDPAGAKVAMDHVLHGRDREGHLLEVRERVRVRNVASVTILALAALKAGGEIGIYDLAHATATDRDARETRMTESLDQQLGASNRDRTAVVVTGLNHAAKLHEFLSTTREVIGLCTVDETFNQTRNSDSRKRASYVHSVDGIFKMKDSGVSSTRPNIIDFAQRRFNFDTPVQWPELPPLE
jgi:hypothetical protein